MVRIECESKSFQNLRRPDSAPLRDEAATKTPDELIVAEVVWQRSATSRRRAICLALHGNIEIQSFSQLCAAAVITVPDRGRVLSAPEKRYRANARAVMCSYMYLYVHNILLALFTMRSSLTFFHAGQTVSYVMMYSHNAPITFLMAILIWLFFCLLQFEINQFIECIADDQ